VLLTLLVEVIRFQRHSITHAELEDVPNLDRGLDVQNAVPADQTDVALRDLAQVVKLGLIVAPGLDAAQVPAGAVRSPDELALSQRLVGDDSGAHADRADRSGVGAERRSDLGRLGG